MAKFIGSFSEFKKYLNDYVKNKIPAQTKKYRAGKCELCGKEATLDSAHIRGRERVVIIKEAFEEVGEHIGGNVYIIDLEAFAQYIYEEHTNPDNFHFICHDCHRKYDAKDSDIQESDFKKNNRI